MIRRITRNFGAPKLSSTINNQNINTNFNGSPRIMYGIPNRWERDSFERPYRPEPLIKYGVPSPADESQMEQPYQNEEEPIVKYGVPQKPILSDVHERLKEKLESGESRFMYGIPAAETTSRDIQEPEAESVEEEPVVEESKTKPSYFKRLFLAIIGKDC